MRISQPQRDWLQHRQITSFECDIEKDKFPFREQSFQFVFFLESIEHLYRNPLHSFLEINRVMQKDGLLFISTPNKASIRRRIDSLLSKDIGQTPFELYRHIALGGRPGHFRLYSKSELEEFLINTGFTIEKTSFFNCSPAVNNDHKQDGLATYKKTWSRIIKKRNYFQASLATLMELLMRAKPDFQETVLICARKNKDRRLLDLK